MVVQWAERANLTWIKLQASLLTFESRLEQLSTANSFDRPSANLTMNNLKTILVQIKAREGSQVVEEEEEIMEAELTLAEQVVGPHVSSVPRWVTLP